MSAPRARRARHRRHQAPDRGDRKLDRDQCRLGLRQHAGAVGLHRNRSGLYRHGHPRGSAQDLRDAALVRQLRMEAARGLRGGRRHGDPRRRLRPGRRQRLCGAGARRILRPDGLHRHRRRQRRRPRPLLRHQLRSGDQFPRVHRAGLVLAGGPVDVEQDVRGAARLGPAGRRDADDLHDRATTRSIRSPRPSTCRPSGSGWGSASATSRSSRS